MKALWKATDQVKFAGNIDFIIKDFSRACISLNRYNLALFRQWKHSARFASDLLKRSKARDRAACWLSSSSLFVPNSCRPNQGQDMQGRLTTVTTDHYVHELSLLLEAGAEYEYSKRDEEKSSIQIGHSGALESVS